MALPVQLDLDLHRFCFADFPTSYVDYQEEVPKNPESFVQLTVSDTKTKQVLSVFLEGRALQDIGISLTAWKYYSRSSLNLTSLLRNSLVIEVWLQSALPLVKQYLSRQDQVFFQDIPSANRLICASIYNQRKHVCGNRQPGIYLHSSPREIFINLKNTPYIGEGGSGKVRKVLWLNGPCDRAEIVAKKVWTHSHTWFIKQEIAALDTFANKRGIVPMLAGGGFDGKFAIFMPYYKYTLYDYLEKRFPLSLNKKLNITSQWLEGLAAISKKGIHGDIKPTNLLIERVSRKLEGDEEVNKIAEQFARSAVISEPENHKNENFGNLACERDHEEIEAVIADFSLYRPHSQNTQDTQGVGSFYIWPPEYYSHKSVSSKYDVWGMGLCLSELYFLEVFVNTLQLPCWHMRTERKMALWISQLTPGWMLEYPTCPDTPPFLVKLINEMLDPRPDKRPSPQEAFERFSAG